MIRQFDVVPNPVRAGRDERPLLVAVQHNFHRDLPTRVLVPLLTAAAKVEQSRLSPVLTVLGKKYVLLATDIVTLALHRLGSPIANLEQDRDRIIAALDLVFTAV